MDDGIRERHGMTVRKLGSWGVNSETAVTVLEHDEGVVILSNTADRVLTVPQARYLARKLYKLARRIEARQAE